MIKIFFINGLNAQFLFKIKTEGAHTSADKILTGNFSIKTNI